MLAANTTFGEGTVVITRVFDAPRALVWQAWTDPKMMGQWFGPRGFTASVPEFDVRVGGALRIVMHGPDGNDYPMKGVFAQVAPPERLVFSNIAIDNDGKHLLEGETVVTLSEQGGKTTLTVKSHMVGLVPIAPQMLAGMEAGWAQSIDSWRSWWLRTAATPPRPRAPRSPTAPPRSSGCGAARRGRWPPPCPATAPGRCA